MKPQNIEILPLALALAALVLSLSSIHQASGAGFVSVSPMNMRRTWHTATLLPNGKVLVAGGYGDAGPTTSAELYDPATDTWTVTGSMKFGGWSATLLPNGKVLVAGGSGSGTSAELYDPAAGTWTLTGSLLNDHLLSALNRPTATLLPNGKVLLVGGGDPNELYDPVDGTWTTTGLVSYSPLTLLPNGNVLAVGGNTATLLLNGKVLLTLGRSLVARLYDPDSGTWSDTGSLAWERDWCTATLLRNGHVLVAGGLWNVRLHIAIPSAELYDPATGTWTEIPMSGRFRHTATLLSNGKVLVAGGDEVISPGDGIRKLSSAQIYEPDPDGVTPSITILHNANQIMSFSWSGVGTLEQSDSLTTPNWQPAPIQDDPHIVSTTEPLRFFRVKAN